MPLYTTPHSRPFTFNESLKLFVLHCPSLEVDLQSHEEDEEEFVVFIQASDRVRENFVCQVLDNICNSLLREWRLLRSAQHFKNQRSEKLLLRE